MKVVTLLAAIGLSASVSAATSSNINDSNGNSIIDNESNPKHHRRRQKNGRRALLTKSGKGSKASRKTSKSAKSTLCKRGKSSKSESLDLVYYSDRALFDAATGGGLSFESFEQDFAISASVDFTDFTVRESGRINFLYQLRDFSSGASLGLSNAITSGTGALWYEDNGNSIATFFDFSTPITAFGIDVTTNQASTITVGGSSIVDSFTTAVNTPQFWGVIACNGITQITFDASGGPNVAFDSASYGGTVE